MLLYIAALARKKTGLQTMKTQVHTAYNIENRVSGVAIVPAWVSAPIVPPAAPASAVRVKAAAVAPVAIPSPTADWDSAIEPPPPCPQCGGLELWQDFHGDWHCQRCEAVAFQRARRLEQKARRLRAVGKKAR
jgi:ribosomal protein S27AE